MDFVLKEICALAQSIAHAPRVSMNYKNKKLHRVEVFARTSGPDTNIDVKYAVPIIGPENPILLARNVKKLDAFKNHPIFEMMPNLTSLAAYYISEDEFGYTYLVVWNPSVNFFENEFTTATMERLVDLAAEIMRPRAPSDQPVQFKQPVLEEEQAVIGDYQNIENEPASQFLIDTLVEKQRLLSRNGCSYLGLRTWRKTIKPYQISALTALKSAPSQPMVDIIAAELEHAILSTYGNTFQTVVPVPCGSSGKGDCLSVQLAQALAKKLGIKFQNILQNTATPGSSHPKRSTKLEPFIVNGQVSGNVLVVDDVVTSGKHMELATKALRPMSSFCTGIAWIVD